MQNSVLTVQGRHRQTQSKPQQPVPSLRPSPTRETRMGLTSRGHQRDNRPKQAEQNNAYWSVRLYD